MSFGRSIRPSIGVRRIGPAREEAMKSPVIRAVPIGMALALFTIADVSAQERCKIGWELLASDSKYTQQLAIDVGDIPGHQVRVLELHRVYLTAKPNCEGLKWTESWGRGYSDYVDRNGRTWGYTVVTLENGDKIYMEWTGTSQTSVGADGSKKTTYEGTARWTGGTGKYQGVRGIEWDHVVFDPGKNLNQLKFEAEYWFEK
jgi:hypothetical protein